MLFNKMWTSNWDPSTRVPILSMSAKYPVPVQIFLPVYLHSVYVVCMPIQWAVNNMYFAMLTADNQLL